MACRLQVFWQVLLFGNSLATFFHMDKPPFIAGGVVLWLIVTVVMHVFLNVMLYVKASDL